MMWKQGSCEDELVQGMEDAQEQALAQEENREGRLIVQAMEELKAAAESFERAGRTERAKEVTALMISLAKSSDRKKSKKKSKDPGKIRTQEAKETFKFFGFKPEDLHDLDASDDKESE